jgi:hypothetical protein
MFRFVINKCDSGESAFIYCVQWVYIFTVVIDKLDSGERAFVHCVQCGLYVLL